MSEQDERAHDRSRPAKGIFFLVCYATAEFPTIDPATILICLYLAFTPLLFDQEFALFAASN
jgi:hypothetical protein